MVAIPGRRAATLIVFLLVAAKGDPLALFGDARRSTRRRSATSSSSTTSTTPSPAATASGWAMPCTGDWGTSFSTGRPVTEMIGDAAWNSFLLVGTAVSLSVVLALVIGAVSAARHRSAVDYPATGFSYFGFSMPDFFFALLLQLVLVVWLREEFDVQLFYVQGKYSVGDEGNLVNLFQHMALPVLTLMLTSVAAWSRFHRDSMLDVLRSDYVRTARAKGVPRRQIIRRHALRNALIPFVTVVAIDTGILLGGVVVVERIFCWPGLGLLFFQALERSDYPVLLAWMAMGTVFVVPVNLAADIAYGVLDPDP